MKKIFDYLRSKFKDHKVYPGTFVVNVSLEHPQIIGWPIAKHRIAIDANSKEHARKRLKEELRIIVGRAERVTLK
jgi:hypothetical protein